MKKRQYKKEGEDKVLIDFVEVYKETFETFKKKFSSKRMFKNMLPDVREVELKRAYNVAIDKEEQDTKAEEQDGNTTAAVPKSKKANTKQS